MFERTHTFGGSALDRHLFDFETAIDATEESVALDLTSGGGPAAEPAGVPADDAGVPSPEPAPPEDPAPPAPAAFTQDEISAQVAQGVRMELERMAADAQRANEPQPEGFDWNAIDPFEDNYGAKLAEGLGHLIRDAIAPLMPVVEQTQAREAQEWTNGQLETLAVPDEDRDVTLYMAGGIEAAAREAGVNADGTVILSHAWQQIQARDERVGAAAVEKFKAELEGAANAPTDVSGAVAATEGFADADDELAVGRLLAERNNRR